MFSAAKTAQNQKQKVRSRFWSFWHFCGFLEVLMGFVGDLVPRAWDWA